MAERKEVFEKLCRELFQFLVDEFGCRLASTKEDGGTHSVIYQNSTTAVGVYFEARDRAVWVVLMRLFKGKRLPYDGSYSHGLRHLIRLRAPSITLEETVHSEADIERVLSEDASAVRTYAADVLQGDFGVFPELERIEAEARRKP